MALMIPMVNLERQYKRLKTQIDRVMVEVCESAQFILGPHVTALEQEIASLHGTSDAVAVASGTDALRLALKVCDIGPGDEVITTPFTFFATAEVILEVGAVPIFADVEDHTFNIDPKNIEACITRRTRAILPVHLFGLPAPMEPIMSIAKRHDLAIIEDCAQAFGARYQDRMVGSFGRCGCFSFYPSKNLGGYGDGGMIITNDSETAEQIRRLRNHGAIAPNQHSAVGFNSRLDELQAAIIRVKLNHIDQMNHRRRENARLYCEHITNTKIVLPQGAQHCRHVYNQFTIRSDQRDTIINWLREHRIASAIYYPTPLHRQPVFKGTPAEKVELPVSERIAQEVVSLPMCPELTEDEIMTICQVVNEAVGSLDFFSSGP